MIIPAVWKLVISFATCIAFIYLVQVVTFIKGITFMPIAFLHFVDKLQSLSEAVITFGAVVGAHSIDNRVAFILDAFDRINDPISLLFGHDRFSEVYFTGDGGLFGYLATHGVILTSGVAICIIWGISLGLSSSDISRRRSAIMLCFLL